MPTKADSLSEPQNIESELRESLKSLEELERYATSIFEAVLPNLSNVGDRQAYLFGLYISMLAQVRGILRLMENQQLRVSRTLLRTMYELWVTTRYIYCLRSTLHAALLVMKSNERQLERLQADKTIGKATEAACIRQRDRLKKYREAVERRYPEWPYPDDLKAQLKLGPKPSKVRGLTFIKFSQTIDYYDEKFNRRRKKGYVSLETHYRSLYDFLSAGPHGDSRELSSVFREVDKNVFEIDVEDQGDADGALRLSTATFALLYEAVVMVKYRVLHEKRPKMPSWIDMEARKIGLIK